MAGPDITSAERPTTTTLPRLQRLARAVLIWESIWPALWPATAVLMVFAVLAVFDLLPMLPGWLHVIILIGFAGSLLAALGHAIKRFRRPRPVEALRRLERDSALRHRPLETLDDRLAGAAADDGTAALWAAHLSRSAAAIGRLRLAWPRAGLVVADPYGVRVALSLVFGIGVLSAGSDTSARFGRALHPELGTRSLAAMAGFDLWITPPEYTGLPPIYESSGGLKSAAEASPVPVPVGSQILARVHGGGGTPSLLLGKATQAFGVVGDTEYSASAPLKEADFLAIRQGGDTLFRLPVRVIPDLPPSAAWRGNAQVTQRSALRLDYTAGDDYGVVGLSILLTPADGKDKGKPVEIEVPIPVHGKDLKESVVEDWTASPYVGLPVELKLVARDAIGQTGVSAPMRLVLPERVFHNPVARAIADQRKLLMRDSGQSDVVTETLGDLAERPERFRNDESVFLALRSAAARLALDTAHENLESIEQLLWDTALRIEDGDVPQAQKSLRQAQQALQQALDRNAPDAEVEALMRQLQQAIDRYLQAMVADARRNGAPPPQAGQPQQGITANDIRKMLDQARDMARTGARDAAKQALANLQNLLEQLRTSPGAGGQNSADAQAMNAMRDLARKQQDLLDKSYRAARQGNRGGEQDDDDDGQTPSAGSAQHGAGQQGAGQQSGSRQPGRAGPADDLAGAQDALRRELGQLMQQMGKNGDTPQGFGHADRAMNGATNALRQGDPQGAVGQQSEALDQLQQAMKQLSEKMGRNGGEGQANGAGHDPFGRSAEGPMDGGDVKLPTAVDVQKSREILDELRRRASEWQRPPVERDYLNRLLQRF